MTSRYGLAHRADLCRLTLLRDFLQSGGVLNLRPIALIAKAHNLMSGQGCFQSWARSEGLAVFGDGSRSGRVAEWVSPAARAMAFDCLMFRWT